MKGLDAKVWIVSAGLQGAVRTDFTENDRHLAWEEEQGQLADGARWLVTETFASRRSDSEINARRAEM